MSRGGVPPLGKRDVANPQRIRTFRANWRYGRCPLRRHVGARKNAYREQARSGSASLSDTPGIYSASMRPSGAGASIGAGYEESRIGDPVEGIRSVGTGSITADIGQEIWTQTKNTLFIKRKGVNYLLRRSYSFLTWGPFWIYGLRPN